MSGGAGLRVVVDTNVWVSGLIVPDGTAGRVLEATRLGLLEPLVSWELAREIVEVLRRPAIRRYGVTEGDIEELLIVLGPLLPDVEIEVDVRDPHDAPVVAAAVAARGEAIVTGDRDLLDDPALRAWLSERSIVVLTPTEVLARLATG
jgi:hypothetical protein